jgi:hypothetical protein
VAKEPTKESILLARESSKDASPTKDPGRDSYLILYLFNEDCRQTMATSGIKGKEFYF